MPIILTITLRLTLTITIIKRAATTISLAIFPLRTTQTIAKHFTNRHQPHKPITQHINNPITSNN